MLVMSFQNCCTPIVVVIILLLETHYFFKRNSGGFLVCDFLSFAGRSGGEEPEPDHSERSEKDLYFSSTDGHHSNEQTSTSEAGTGSSSLDGEDSLQLQTPPPVPTTTFLPTKIIAAPLSALARFHLPSPSGTIFFFFSCLFFSLYTFQENPTIVISRPFAY